MILVPYIEGTWSAFGEIAIIMAGAWALYAQHAGPWDKAKLNWAVGARGVRNARLLLSLSIPLCGLAHLVYSDLTAPFIPGWIPFHMFWVILTGSAGILAGFGILFGVYARLAAVLEAAMLGSMPRSWCWEPGGDLDAAGSRPVDGFPDLRRHRRRRLARGGHLPRRALVRLPKSQALNYCLPAHCTDWFRATSVTSSRLVGIRFTQPTSGRR